MGKNRFLPCRHSLTFRPSALTGTSREIIPHLLQTRRWDHSSSKADGDEHQGEAHSSPQLHGHKRGLGPLMWWLRSMRQQPHSSRRNWLWGEQSSSGEQLCLGAEVLQGDKTSMPGCKASASDPGRADTQNISTQPNPEPAPPQARLALQHSGSRRDQPVVTPGAHLTKTHLTGTPHTGRSSSRGLQVCAATGITPRWDRADSQPHHPTAESQPHPIAVLGEGNHFPVDT